ALARGDVARIDRDLVGQEIADFAADLVGAVERAQYFGRDLLRDRAHPNTLLASSPLVDKLTSSTRPPTHSPAMNTTGKRWPLLSRRIADCAAGSLSMFMILYGMPATSRMSVTFDTSRRCLSM